MKVVCDEVFGPVVSIVPYKNFDQVCRTISDSRSACNAASSPSSSTSPSGPFARSAQAASSMAARPGARISSPMAA